jgi:predicted RND superfamily exporter protein
MVANHRGLVSLGLVLTLGVTFCMVAALMLLPAALRLMGREEKAVEPEVIRRAA